MHVICVDRKLRRDLHIPPRPPAPPPPPPPPPPLMKSCLCQASPRVNLTLGGPSPPHRLSHLSFKSGLDLLLHTPFSLILCILSRQSFFFFFFLIWKSSSGRFKRHKDERAALKKNVSTSSHAGEVVNSNPYSVDAYVQKKKKIRGGNYHDKTCIALITCDIMRVKNLHHKGAKTSAKRMERY